MIVGKSGMIGSGSSEKRVKIILTQHTVECLNKSDVQEHIFKKIGLIWKRAFFVPDFSQIRKKADFCSKNLYHLKRLLCFVEFNVRYCVC